MRIGSFRLRVIDGAALALARDRMNLSQAALATHVGLAAAVISMAETRGRATLRTVNKLAAALHVQPGDLLGEPQPEVDPGPSHEFQIR